MTNFNKFWLTNNFYNINRYQHGMNKSNGCIMNYQPLVDNNFEQEQSTPNLTTSSAKYLKSANTTNDFSDTSINNESVKIEFNFENKYFFIHLIIK
jgi:hypothetical protein